MGAGEFLTKSTVWLALLGYTLGAGGLLAARGRAAWLNRARWVWTAGCLFFIAHVAAAFSFYHHWSHSAAYLETARRTAELTGVSSGCGLYLNYLFGVAWLADAVGWWGSGRSLPERAPRLAKAWHGFAFFMVFNGTVVFGHGPVRWLGVGITVTLGWRWLRRRG